MINNMHTLLLLALTVTGLFVVVIGVGLALSRCLQARTLHDIDAAIARSQFDQPPTPEQLLLYGIWQTSMGEVMLIVRDQHDTEVGQISRRLSGTTISTGASSYRVVAATGHTERAELMDMASQASTPSAVLCRFESHGWFGSQMGSYSPAEGSVLTVRARWSWPWRRTCLPIYRDARRVGEFTALGTAIARGVAISLPTSVPLPMALFMLSRAAGTQLRPASR